MKRLLVVDDAPDILECLRIILGTAYEVVVASDGEEALEKVRAEPIDAILLDVMMPVLDGPGVVKALRSMGLDTPVVLASAATNPRRYAEAFDVAGYITKPYDLDALRATLSEALAADRDGFSA